MAITVGPRLLADIDSVPLLAGIFFIAGLYVAVQGALESTVTAGMVRPDTLAMNYGALGTVNGTAKFISSATVGVVWSAVSPVLGFGLAAPLIGEPERWARYVLDSLIETSISRDVLLLTRVDKPALLRQLFELACRYSGQVLSYTKMLGQLQDAGNTTTLAHYLELLAGAGMVCGLSKYAGDVARSRASSPKLQVLNTALMTVAAGLTPEEARTDREFRGRLVESAVGAHLANAAQRGECRLYYWRERNHEVDFVVKAGRRLTAIEVKSGRAPQAHPGTAAFVDAFKPQRTLLIGGDGIALEDFLARPVSHWTGA